MLPSRALCALTGIALTLIVAGCAIEPPAPGTFYQVDSERLAGRPGELLRSEPFAGAPSGASAYRVLYRSTGQDGKPSAVSGVVIVPGGPPPRGGRNIVAWAHPTTGIADDCAPSLSENFYRSIPGLADFLARGYVVVATDYEGLGTAGMHPYLVGNSEARAVLDSVRAAQRLSGTQGTSRFAVWGHSQGGQAALFTGQIAAEYAPELQLVGVAAAAPATELSLLLQDDFGTAAGRLLTAYTLVSWSSVYTIPIERVVVKQMLPVVTTIASRCIESREQALLAMYDVRPLANAFLVPGAMKAEPWTALMSRNQPGHVAAGAPLFVAQGTTDDIVLPAITASWVSDACKRGERVRYLVMPDVPHVIAGVKSAPAAAEWIGDRFAGSAIPDDCAKLKANP